MVTRDMEPTRLAIWEMMSAEICNNKEISFKIAVSIIVYNNKKKLPKIFIVGHCIPSYSNGQSVLSPVV